MNEQDQEDEMHYMRPPRTPSELSYYLPTPPTGLAALYTLCRRTYPDQCNPLQATTVVKYW